MQLIQVKDEDVELITVRCQEKNFIKEKISEFQNKIYSLGEQRALQESSLIVERLTKLQLSEAHLLLNYYEKALMNL